MGRLTMMMMLMGAAADVRLFQAEGGGTGGGAGGGADGAANGSGAGAGAAGGAGAGEGSGGAGGAGAAGGQGDAGNGNNGGGAGDGGAGNKPWYEARGWSDPALQQHLIKSGYHNGTAEEALEKALKGEIHAAARLGRNPATLLDAPAEGQSFTDWMKANGKTFGAPDDPAKYEVKLPDGLPQGMPIDDALLSDFKAHAHASGMPPALVQANVDFWAKAMGGRFTSIAAESAKAEAALNTTLQGEWGGNWKQNQQDAVRTFQALAASMKLDPAATNLVAQKMNEGMGDATLLKFFHGLHGKLGEDTLAIPRGGNAPALQLAEAQQRKEVIMARHTGEMSVAVKAGDQRRITALQKELEGLNLIIGQHGG
ncbi:hypothetical protein MASR1M32_10560 [Rhodobacter sp.]